MGLSLSKFFKLCALATWRDKIRIGRRVSRAKTQRTPSSEKFFFLCDLGDLGELGAIKFLKFVPPNDLTVSA
jgi:hypothetical protein